MNQRFAIFLGINIILVVRVWLIGNLLPSLVDEKHLRHTNENILSSKILLQFEKRQRHVDIEIQERTLWECNGKCAQCVSEFIDPPQPPIPFRSTSQSCPVECDLSGIEIETTMENQGCWKGNSRKVCGNTRRNSDVHMQYYSWELVDFMRFPVVPQKSIFLSSFISNCNGGDRLEWMSSLERALKRKGENRIHNYGACNRDTFVPETESKAKFKDEIAQKSYFVFSFENSQTEDYVTEKMFDMLSSSTIPVYRGATNARVYAPSRQSVVFANDYLNADMLADALLNISHTYEQYFEWKTKGPDLKWITLIDEGIVHSQCRICILLARNTLHTSRWFIRERGTHAFIGFNDTYQTLYELQYEISQTFIQNKPNGSGAVIQIYQAWDRNQCSLQTLDAMKSLPYASHLEVILENPGWHKRVHFDNWWKNHNGNPLT